MIRIDLETGAHRVNRPVNVAEMIAIPTTDLYPKVAGFDLVLYLKDGNELGVVL